MMDVELNEFFESLDNANKTKISDKVWKWCA
jgi:hypothetical protein